MQDRRTLSRKELETAISVRFRHAPKWVWGKDPAFEKLKAERRQNPEDEPVARQIAAAMVADMFEELGWEVSYEPPKPMGSPRGYRG